MAEMQGVIKFEEQEAFCKWAIERGYEFDDMLSVGFEVFRLTKPGEYPIIFYKPQHLELLTTSHGPGFDLVKAWRKELQDNDLSFLD